MTAEIEAATQAIAEMDAVPMILDIVCRTTGMGFAAVARVTEHRWVACSLLDTIEFGLLPGGELDPRTTLCDQVRGSGQAVVIEDARSDPVYQAHPTPKLYGFLSYVSTPIVRKDGAFFGTLCAIDPQPRRVNTPEVLGMFKAFADLIAAHLDQRDSVTVMRQALAEQRRDGTLREEFIAVLGHDLRNPLQAIGSAAELLRKQALDDRGVRLLDLMEGSVGRMSELVANLLDLARGRMGGGLKLDRIAFNLLGPVLEQVVAEQRAIAPGRDIQTLFDLHTPVLCDPARVGQLLSNLLANAVSHGSAEGPIHVRASSADGGLDLSVANTGPPIPPAALEKLFDPFYREAGSNRDGLGLGLYIAGMIARAHGGRMAVTSDVDETRFTFRIPPAA